METNTSRPLLQIDFPHLEPSLTNYMANEVLNDKKIARENALIKKVPA